MYFFYLLDYSNKQFYMFFNIRNLHVLQDYCNCIWGRDLHVELTIQLNRYKRKQENKVK